MKTHLKTKNTLCGLAMAVVLHFGVLAASAQTCIYTYTGNDFTSASGPYTTSDKVTGSIAFSAPLGDNYEGNPLAAMLNFNFSDGVGPQNVGGGPGELGLRGGLIAQNFIFDTDSSGTIVSWNFEVLDFLPPSRAETKGIQTENDSGGVMDSGNLDESSGIVGEGSVSGNPGAWVETIVPEPSVGRLFVLFAALIIGIRAVQRRFKMKSKNALCGLAMAVVLQLGMLAVSAQDASSTNADGSIYTYSTNTDGSANIVAYAGPPWVVTIPSKINGLTVTSIGFEAFANTSLASVTIPDTVTSIGVYAFEGTSLTSVTIPDSVTSIADGAFSDCIYLTSVTIGNSVTSIGSGAFDYCLSLTSVTIPNSVTSLVDFAFAQCYSLTNVTIGNSVTSIGDEAFVECYSLTGVYFTGNAPSPNDLSVFLQDTAIVYYLPGTTGWGAMFDGRPTAPWFLPNPVILNHGPGFGVQPGGFGFTISWATNASVVVEAATNLANPVWMPVSTNPLTSGTNYFSDPQWTNYPARFYRAVGAFTVGGTLAGLPAGDTVTLQDNGGDNLTLSTNGTFTFPTALPNGQSYSVTVSGTSGGTETTITLMNGSGTISGANVTNVAVQCPPLYTGNLDVDMYNAALADGTANGGVPGIMLTENGGPFRVTAAGNNTVNVAIHYSGSSQCTFAITVGSTSCSATTFPSGTPVIQFGGALECGSDFYGY